jgi:ferrous iron transport protein A
MEMKIVIKNEFIHGFSHGRRLMVMPLSMMGTGEPCEIKKVGGKEETRRFLENLGFVAGGIVTVVSEINGNMIVNIKDSRIAIGKDMACKIMV